ncbi:MAG: hypothetical protein R3F11_02385 [Verrucomicrobiales bacterium]
MKVKFADFQTTAEQACAEVADTALHALLARGGRAAKAAGPAPRRGRPVCGGGGRGGGGAQLEFGLRSAGREELRFASLLWGSLARRP